MRLAYDGEMSVITDGIYVGRYRAARDRIFLRNCGITHIVNCAAGSCDSMFPHDFCYLDLPLKDEPASEDELHRPMTPLAAYIPSASLFIQKCLDSGGRVMVHCRKGVSRSVAIVAGYMMYQRNSTLSEAFGVVRKRRKVADPNIWFVEDLKTYQLKLMLDRCHRYHGLSVGEGLEQTVQETDLEGELENGSSEQQQPGQVGDNAAMEIDEMTVEAGEFEEEKNQENLRRYSIGGAKESEAENEGNQEIAHQKRMTSVETLTESSRTTPATSNKAAI